VRAELKVYPRLGRYFKNADELASAGCMKRNRLYQICKGEKEFTEEEKRAIANSIIGKMIAGEIDKEELQEVVKARYSFDEVFKTKE
jgi:hypothetical protein